MLKARDLNVVSAPITHTRGAALGVHITAEAWRYKLSVYTFPSTLSDHSLSSVHTDIQVRLRATARTVHNKEVHRRVVRTKTWKHGHMH